MDNLRRTATENLARRLKRAERRSGTATSSCKATILSARSTAYQDNSQQSCARFRSSEKLQPHYREAWRTTLQCQTRFS